MKTGVPAMRTGVPCNENRFFPVWKTSQGKPCSGPVLALYRIAVWTWKYFSAKKALKKAAYKLHKQCKIPYERYIMLQVSQNLFANFLRSLYNATQESLEAEEAKSAAAVTFGKKVSESKLRLEQKKDQKKQSRLLLLTKGFQFHFQIRTTT